eukprot:GHVR01075807.1.p1 GENE.GHVR01075807.1~~GHVR01075807.1.p1  ORF type:complete len:359 (+),score=69.33 GHVR01075807.1:16-1092(+)
MVGLLSYVTVTSPLLVLLVVKVKGRHVESEELNNNTNDLLYQQNYDINDNNTLKYKHCNVLLLTSGDVNSLFYKEVINRKKYYADIHNYCYMHYYCDYDNNPNCIVPHIHRYIGFIDIQKKAKLGEGVTFDWVLYTDNDVLLTDITTPIHVLIHKFLSTDPIIVKGVYKKDAVDLILPTDAWCHKGDPYLVNSGVMLIRNTPRMTQMAMSVIYFVRYEKVNHLDQGALTTWLQMNGDIPVKSLIDMCRKPDKMNTLMLQVGLGRPPMPLTAVGGTVIVPNKYIDSFMRLPKYKDKRWTTWTPGDYAIHLTGMTQTERDDVIRVACQSELNLHINNGGEYINNGGEVCRLHRKLSPIEK